MINRCLDALEELQLENERLVEEKSKLEDRIDELQEESKKKDKKINGLKAQIAKYQNLLEDRAYGNKN